MLLSFFRLVSPPIHRKQFILPSSQAVHFNTNSEMDILRSFWNSPIGPKTTHFWGPTFNWSLPIAAAMDTKKPPEMISANMTAVMCVYSASFMRFAWVVRPRNLHLLVCHVSNETVQLYQLSRCLKHQWHLHQKKEEAADTK